VEIHEVIEAKDGVVSSRCGAQRRAKLPGRLRRVKGACIRGISVGWLICRSQAVWCSSP